MTADLPTLVREIGRGAWLFALLDLHSTPAAPGEDWHPVASGRLLADTELGWRLGVSVPTIRRWRADLEYFGLIQTVRGKGGNVYRVKACWLSGEPDAPPPTPTERETQRATQWAN